MNQETPTTRPANKPAVRTTTRLPIIKPVISDITKGGSSAKPTRSSEKKFTVYSTLYSTLVKKTLKIPARTPTSKVNRYRSLGLPGSTVAAPVVPIVSQATSQESSPQVVAQATTVTDSVTHSSGDMMGLFTRTESI